MRRLPATLTVLALACAGPSSDDRPRDAACELGTGETELVRLDDGGELPVIIGPQGGWHVLGSVRCEGVEPGSDIDPFDPDNPTVRWVLEDPDGLSFAGYESLRRPMDRGGEAALLGELIVIWTATYEEAIDRDATMVFELTDVDGHAIALSRDVRLVSEDGWTPDTDAR